MNNLLWARILNALGDWFYYFEIVILVFEKTKSPIIMTLLSLAYILPGLLFSNTIAKVYTGLNIKKSLILANIIRAILIALMFYSKNVLLILVLVFLEQILSIVDYTSSNMLATCIIEEDDLPEFNGTISFWSNISRLFVLPFFLIFQSVLRDEYILWIDVALTLISVFFLFKVKAETFLFPQESQNEKRRRVISIDVIIKNFILLFSIFALIRVTLDTYLIVIVDGINTGGFQTNTIYTIATLFMIGGLIISSKLSTKVIKQEFSEINITIIIFLIMVVLLFVFNINANIFIFLVNIMLLYGIINLYELHVLFKMQKVKNNRSETFFFQVKLYNFTSVLSLVLSGVYIEKLGIKCYILTISVFVIICSGLIVLKIWKGVGNNDEFR